MRNQSRGKRSHKERKRRSYLFGLNTGPTSYVFHIDLLCELDSTITITPNVVRGSVLCINLKLTSETTFVEGPFDKPSTIPYVLKLRLPLEFLISQVNGRKISSHLLP